MTSQNTTKPIATQFPESGKLERLGFIVKAGQSGLNVASSLYVYGKSWVPKPLVPSIEMGEAMYDKYAQPLVGSIANFGNNILLLVDGKVRVLPAV